jgi:hypothetical protein
MQVHMQHILSTKGLGHLLLCVGTFLAWDLCTELGTSPMEESIAKYIYTPQPSLQGLRESRLTHVIELNIANRKERSRILLIAV